MSSAAAGDVINVAVMGDPIVPCTAMYRCPGCKRIHALGINNMEPGRPNWTWNNDPIKPMFSPSISYTSTWKGEPIVCHSFIGINGAAPGEAIFLGDCTHENAGKVLPLPAWREDEDDQD